ncbi:MAG: sugar phosphate isomerase/epimerase [bacterium]|nr:sugar phosphate isomerase/epimerase [bacterium]
MTKPAALQLYSIRDALSADFEGSLRRAATVGFAGVEFAGVYGESPTRAAALCADLGLHIASAHMPMPLGDQQNQVIENAQALGAKTIVCPWLPPDRFRSLENIQSVCDDLNAAYQAAAAAGLRYAYHNHDFEFTPLDDGSLPHDHMQRLLDPAILFELDIYWVRHAGSDPSTILNQIAPRTPLVHVKDGTGVPGEPFVAAGEGIVDIPAAVHAAGDHPEWLIVELDSCATDMFTAVEKSLRYLIDQGLAHGR